MTLQASRNSLGIMFEEKNWNIDVNVPFGSSTISTIPHENIIIAGVVDYGNGVSRIKQMR